MRTPRPRDITHRYQTAARAWLTAAGLAWALPPAARDGAWLPLHLALAGAATVAISGAMQNFAVSLAAAPSPPAAVVWSQLALVNLGAALIAIGWPAGIPALMAAGGTAFVAAILLLGGIVVMAERRSLHRRHRLPIRMYQAAAACVIAGGTIGALLGSGAVRPGRTYDDLVGAHMALNVLGFVGLTICGTLVTLLPTMLRVRIPAWPGRASTALLGCGVAAVAVGLAAGAAPLAAAGGAAYAAGALGVAVLVVRVLRAHRRWRPPISAAHVVAGVAWFVAGAVALAAVLPGGDATFQGFLPVFLVVFPAGFVVQTLLGAWLYLLPMARPAHPNERRAMLKATEVGAALQVAVGNVGLALMALRAAGLVPFAAGALGAALALAAGAAALAKAWAYPLLARLGVAADRSGDVWGG